MDLLYQIKYLTKKAMLTVMGPAELDEHVDPVKRLDREKAARTGDKAESKPPKEYPKKRKFEGDGSTTSPKKASVKKAPATKSAAKSAVPAKSVTAKNAVAKKTTSKARRQPGS